ncbi:TolC family protein [Noviherbaspirillum humi]|uniref:TolC family protein n=1 Tax=Noviherbaspirillum humi TaxID=1688639 RepID=UPI0015956764|nr:TolC family protein [Noviherbaspirillum humi]
MSKKTILSGILGVWSLVGVEAKALDLVEAYQRALSHDPTFQSAIAERQGGEASAAQARAALFPEASYSRNQQTERGAGSTITISQPLFSLDRYATYKQSEPRRAFAEATFAVRQQDLAQRLVKAVADLVRARETIVLNEARIANLEKQSERAERLYQLGQGTVTDLRDIKVKFQQAKANQITYLAQTRAAERQFVSLTGVAPGTAEFRLNDAPGLFPLPPLEQCLTLAMEANPQLEAARHSERISELEAQRVRGSMLPTVALAHVRSRQPNGEVNSSGVMISAPINAGNYYSSSSAAANAVRSKEERRALEEKTRVQIERLYGLVEAARTALAIKKSAIEAAEFSVDANNRSYLAGVRSNIDVLNSIQTLYEVKNDFVTSTLDYLSNLTELNFLVSPAFAQDMLRLHKTFFL